MARTKEYYEKMLKELELREAANKAIGELRKFREQIKKE